MAINSRKKGARTERIVAKLLEAWAGAKFAKTPASGGLQWKSANAKGDVVCTTEGHFFPFCIEVKFHNKIDFSHLLIPGIKNIDIIDFWNQCARDAKLCSKTPLLLMRYNGLPKEFFFLVIEQSFARKMRFGMPKVRIQKTFKYTTTDTKLVIMQSTEFFKLSYKEIKPIARKHGKKSS